MEMTSTRRDLGLQYGKTLAEFREIFSNRSVLDTLHFTGDDDHESEKG